MKKSLTKALEKAVSKFAPPENLPLSQWADKYRYLSTEASAEAGRWRTDRTPYLREPMDAITDEAVHWVTLVAASQVGKTEIELNFLAYIIDQDPSSVLYIHPTEKDAENFSAFRITPMIRDTRRIRYKVSDYKGRDAKNTKMQKTFPGGVLNLAGSNAASPLASKPIRILICDEIDRWAHSAGKEGDPFSLAHARQTTFYNWKTMEVSTPTIKGASLIAKHYEEGTQERYESKCPHCGKYSEITWESLHFQYEKRYIEADGSKVYELTTEVEYLCPHCGCYTSEKIMKKQPAKWVARNREALKQGHRSFWLNAFMSPWVSWSDIAYRFLNAKDDPKRLQVIKNTLFGELWEDYGAYAIDPTGLYGRRESYGFNDDGTPIEVPEEVGYLTMAVDTQDNRFEYEILGHGIGGETYGIKKGMILGRPDDVETQNRLRDVILQPRYFKNKQYSLRPALTFIDSGGHFTQAVYRFCQSMFHYKVFPIKGKGGRAVNFTNPPNRVPIGGSREDYVWLYTIGVDEGKEKIMNNLDIQQPGPQYCHFPENSEAGYDRAYFLGLISERLEQVENKQTRQLQWRWVKIEGRERNEPLDLRNYNLAAAQLLGLNAEIEIQKRKNPPKPVTKQAEMPRRRFKETQIW